MDDGSDGGMEDGTYNLSDSDYDDDDYLPHDDDDEESEQEIEAENEQEEENEEDDAEENEEDDDEEEEEEPVTFSQIWGNAVEEEEEEHRSTPISFTSTIRVSANAAEEKEQQQQQQRKAEEEHDQRRREERESSGNGVCCSICMEPWSSQSNHQVSCLPCGHVYGLSCIKKWIERSTYSKCPQCNRQCRLEDIIKVYVPRLVVVDGEQQKKILSLQAKNDFLKMTSEEVGKRIIKIRPQINWIHEKNKRLAWNKYCTKEMVRRFAEFIYKGQGEKKEEIMRLLFIQPSHSISIPQFLLKLIKDHDYNGSDGGLEDGMYNISDDDHQQDDEGTEQAIETENEEQQEDDEDEQDYEEEEVEEDDEEEDEDDEEEDEDEEEEEEPVTFSQIWGNVVEEEDEDHLSTSIPFISTIRVSSNSPSGTSVQPILCEQRIAEEEHDQRRREDGESSGNGADGVCCSICMEPWSSQGNHQVSCLPCGHVYGLSCIKKWIRRSTYSKCPQCNRQCRLKDIITLYVPRLAVVDGEQQKKILSLQAENDFLKMKVRTSSCKKTAARLVVLILLNILSCTLLLFPYNFLIRWDYFVLELSFPFLSSSFVGKFTTREYLENNNIDS